MSAITSNIFGAWQDRMLQILARLQEAGALPPDLDTSKVAVEPPRDPTHGDMATNAAMVLARAAGMKPRDLAALIVERLGSEIDVTEAAIAGPGFVNLRLAGEAWREAMLAVLAGAEDFGRSTIGQGRRVNVEYVSANPTGPLHAGHVRGAVFGDALANLLEKAGYSVTREYYINDAGAQVQTLARSAHLRYREALGEDIPAIPEGYYPGAYLKEVGQALAKEFGDKYRDAPEEDWLDLFRGRVVDILMRDIKDDLNALGIMQNPFTSEYALTATGAVDQALADLEAKGLLYTGVLEPPKGKKPEDWEERPQLLFRSTDWGDDVDRPLKKSDGSFTYFAADIAYHRDKIRRGADILIDVWGADHGGYVKRMEAAVAALTDRSVEFDVKICQLVHVLDGGVPVKLSKRAGTIITLREILEAVGRDVVRFIMLTRRNDQALEFDFQAVKAQSKDNPVFYVQYAHARCCSVLRHAEAEIDAEALTPAALARARLSMLTEAEDLDLVKLMVQYPRVIEAAALAHEPHRVTFFLIELASAFHALWNRGREATALRFLHPDNEELTRAKLALVKALALVLADGLQVLGVKALEEMA